MQIRLKTILAGPILNGQPGDILELDEKEAKPLLKGGFAEEVDSAADSGGAKDKEEEKASSQTQSDETQS